MYCKLFASLYQGTLRGRSHEILVFTNLLAHATKDGTVDKHFRAIAEETGLSIDDVKAAIVTLESPDEESRSPEAQGARLQRIDEHRVWGWHIVNYAKYRAIRSEDDRAEQNRLAQARWREKNKKNKPQSAVDNTDKPKDREKQKAEGEVQAEGVPKPQIPKPSAPSAWNPSPEQLTVGSWFHRRPTTPWTSKELKAWKMIPADSLAEGIEVLAAPYLAKEKFIRQELETLLNNWQGQIDRWRSYRPALRSDVQAIDCDNDDLGFLNNDDAIFHKP